MTVLAGSARANFSASSIGTSGSDFLTLDVGARGIGMGSAYTALSDDAYSLYWNPAGLAQIQKASVALMETQYFAGINYYYTAYAQRFPNWGGVLGGGLRYLDVGNIGQTDINGNSQGSFHPQSFAYELGYAQKIPDLSDSGRDVTAGGTFRLIHSDIVSHATGVSFDAGSQARYNSGKFPYQYGFVIQNVGQGQKFDATRDSLPTQLRMGGAINLTSNFLASADAVFPFYDQIYAALGGEMTIQPMDSLTAAFRMGLNTQSLTGGLDGFRGFNFGLGITFANFTFDYAFVPYGVLGNTNRFSLSYRFEPANGTKYRER